MVTPQPAKIYKNERSVAYMLKLVQSILSANRKRRRLAVAAALWLLRAAHDAEMGALDSWSNKLGEFHSDSQKQPLHDYDALEGEIWDCELVLGFLESAIEDLEFAGCV